jgi:WD40 repeat protein
VWDARVSPDGREVAVASERGQILIWRLDRPGAPIRRLVGHEGHINAIAYARDGRIASAGADSTVRVWNPRTGRAVVLRGHTDEVTGVAFTPDGRFVVSTSADGTARLWNAAGGDALAVLQSGSVPVYDVAIARDGTIATLDGHEVVRVFRCPVCGTLGQVRTLADSRHPRALTAAERRRYLSDAG